jgi:hypothetical protein
MRYAKAAALAAALPFLFAAPVGAHDPGLSSLDIELGDARIVATLSLSRADASVAAESAGESIEVVALRSTILEVDGVRLAGRLVTRATERDAGTRLAIAFSHASGSRLKVRSTWAASLATGHRQLLTVRDADDRRLIQRMLDGKVDHVDIDLASGTHAPATTLALLATLLLGVSGLRAIRQRS